MIYIGNKFLFDHMQIHVLKSDSKEANLSIKEADIGTLYVIQHELLKTKNVDFAGVVMKHPLTNEIWMRINSKESPIKNAVEATNSAIKSVDDLKKLLNSRIK